MSLAKAVPAYCFKSGKRRNGRPKCVLLSGHTNPCQTEVSPPLTAEDYAAIAAKRKGNT